jgi:CMP-N-acetylneuraminic acid synthetase
VIRHALLSSEEFYKTSFDILVDLDATSPLRSVTDIVNCVRLLEEKKYGNLITAMPARRSPYFNLVEVTTNGNVVLSKKSETPINRRQDVPLCYDMNASIYVWSRSALLEREGLFHPDTGLYVMPEDRSIDIDSALDFDFVEFIMNRNQNATK